MQHIPSLFATAIIPSQVIQHPDMVNRLFEEVCNSQQWKQPRSPRSDALLMKACGWWIDCLYQGFCCIPAVPVALSLARATYSKSGYCSIPHTYAAVVRAVKCSKTLGWVDHVAGCNGPDGSRALARYSASGDLLDKFLQQGVIWSPRLSPDREQLVLISTNSKSYKRSVAVCEHPEVAIWRDQLHRINCLIGQTPIYLDLPDTEWAKVTPKNTSKSKLTSSPPLCLTQTALRRMFTRDKFDHGGRFYGGWWQNIPSAYRRHIVIGGELTVECDYSGIAMRCLYAREGIKNVPDDPYEIGLNFTGKSDPRRGIVKTYINAALNDEKNKYQLPIGDLLILGLTENELKQRVLKKHADIARHFHTGVGMELQFIDSEIAMAVMLRLADMGEVCLPVHDSFIVRGAILDELQNVMQQEFTRVTGIATQISTDNALSGDRIGQPLMNFKGPSRTDAVVAALNEHYNRFSITQQYHAEYCNQISQTAACSEVQEKKEEEDQGESQAVP